MPHHAHDSWNVTMDAIVHYELREPNASPTNETFAPITHKAGTHVHMMSSI